jgi:hypothetical protein
MDSNPDVFVPYSSFKGKCRTAQELARNANPTDGSKINCFASGDEFYNFLHTAEGYVIKQNLRRLLLLHAKRR